MVANANNLHSSYREMLLEHLFAGAVMRHLWLRGYERVEMLKPQVDASGYDVVLEANSIVRHIQLKSSHAGASTHSVNINIALARKPSGCVVWMYFDPDTLEFNSFLWFGGEPGRSLPNLSNFPNATHTKGNSQGEKTVRPNIHVVRKGAFTKIIPIDELVTKLFGDFPNSVKTIEDEDL